MNFLSLSSLDHLLKHSFNRILSKLENIMSAPIFFQLSIFGLMLAVVLFELDNVSIALSIGKCTISIPELVESALHHILQLNRLAFDSADSGIWQLISAVQTTFSRPLL